MKLEKLPKAMGIEVDTAMGKGKLIDEIFGRNVRQLHTTYIYYRLSKRDEPLDQRAPF